MVYISVWITMYLYLYIPSGKLTNIAIENSNLEWFFPLKMVIFHGYVK